MDTILKILSQFLTDAAFFVSYHPIPIRVAMAVLMGCCALVFLLLWIMAVKEERWVILLGLASACYMFEYGAHSFLAYLAKLSLIPRNENGIIAGISAICSCLINILFFASARELLGATKRYHFWIYSFITAGSIYYWAYSDSWWGRVPDAIITALCAGGLGYAISRNIGFRLRRGVTITAIVFAAVYGLLLIAYSIYHNSGPAWLPPINDYLAPREAAYNQSIQPRSLITIGIFILLPFKLGLFFSALYVAIQSMMVVSSNQAQKMLRSFLDGKQEYLSHDGVIKSIGEITHASRASIHLLLPGSQIKQVAQFEWSNQAPTSPKPNMYLLSSAQNRLAGAVISGEEEVIYTKRFERFSRLNLHLEDVDPKTSVVAVPIRFHGAIIGCLSIKWEAGMAFTRTAVKQIRNLADLIAPIAQSYREIAALDQLSFRFTGWHAGKKALPDITVALEEMAGILHDITSPLATIISMNFGFHLAGCMWRADGDNTSLVQAEITDEYVKAKTLIPGKKKDIEVVRGRLLVKIPHNTREGSNKLPIGELVFSVPWEKDDLTRPTLARQYLYRRAIRAIVADELFEISRQHLNGVLRDFSIRLSSHEIKSATEWFYELWRAARAAGLLWAVASQKEDDELLGGAFWKGMIKNIDEERTYCLTGAEGEFVIHHIPMGRPVEETHHILKFYLQQSRIWIWLGVKRSGFGPELDFPSPWRIFLERFAGIADASLTRLAAAHDFQRMQIETAQAQGLATVAVTTGTLQHQLTNLVKDIANPISSLNEAVTLGKLKIEGRWKQLVTSMTESADTLLNLSAAVMDVTKIDNHRPCNLREAARNSERLFAIALEHGRISLEIDLGPDLEIDVPFHVASLAIANLVNNAKDALFSMKPAPTTTQFEMSGDAAANEQLSFSEMNGAAGPIFKHIRIEAEDAGEMIHCRVTDNGPGVPPAIRDQIFNLGVTTKPSGGWGLFLVKRSLQENRGYIDLIRTGPEGTQFMIRFPKPRQEA